MKTDHRLFSATLLAVFSGAFGEAGAECKMPDPPIFHAQGRIFAFETLDADRQKEILAFEKLPASPLDVQRLMTVNRLDNGTPMGGPDGRDADQRYLEPDHPGGQPRIPQSDWKRVNCVPASDVTWQVRPKIESGSNGKVHFNALPNVKPPSVIRTTYVRTAQGIFPGEVDLDGDGVKETVDPFANPPGTNMLPTVFENLRNTKGREMLNTLPSTKKAPYNLHEGKPKVVRINPESPADDLKYLMTVLYEVLSGEPYEQLLARSDGVTVQDLIKGAAHASDNAIASRSLVQHHIQWALDIIEGNNGPDSKVPADRAYRGFSLLNHSGHKRVKRVMPVYDANGKVRGGEVTIRQIWYGGRIQSDTMFMDFGYQKGGGPIDYANCGGPGEPSDQECRNGLPPIPPNKPWKIHFQIHVLNRGNDDFSPMTMQFDCPSRLVVDGQSINVGGNDKDHCPGPEVDIPVGQTEWSNGPLYASLDQSFFPMTDGTRVDLTTKMAPPQFYNLTYTWGWRVHPPRAQATENGEKVIPPPISDNPTDPFHDSIQMYCHPLRAAIIEHERWAFEGFPGPEKLPQEVRDLPGPELFAQVQQLASMLGLALPAGTPGGGDDRIDACFNQFKAALTSASSSEHFRQAGAGLQAICQGRPPNSDNQITPPDMMDARLCLLKAFFPAPSGAEPGGDYDPAIDKIADLAPAKRMWHALRALRLEAAEPVPADAGTWIPLMLDLRGAYLDWLDRTRLPSGIKPDPKADLTVLFANNTTYGQLRTGGYVEFPDWRRRGDKLRVTLLNADYFPHGYLNVDFGGARGWENLWQSTIKTAGSGPWFTFGRFHSRFSTVPGSIAVGAAKREGTSSQGVPEQVHLQAHRLMIEYNFEPSPRLRFYQFDPLHHDAAIYSIH